MKDLKERLMRRARMEVFHPGLGDVDVYAVLGVEELDDGLIPDELSQEAAGDIEQLEAKVMEQAQALVAHNDALRTAATVAARAGATTNWPGLHNQLCNVLHEYHATTNAARALLDQPK